MQQGRILVVDDEPGFCQIVSKLAKMQNLTADVAQTKDAAIDLISRYAYSVALIDINLSPHRDQPDTDGFDVAAEIEAAGEGTYRIMISANDHVPTALKGNALGDAYIYKPDTTNKEIAEKILNGSRQFKAKHFGKCSSLVQYIAVPQDPGDWSGLVISQLGGPYARLASMLGAALHEFLPVLHRTSGGPMFALDESRQALRGTFWTKTIGKSVELEITRADDTKSELLPFELISERVHGDWRASIYDRPDLERSGFARTTSDIVRG